MLILKNAGALDLCPSSMNLDNTKILSLVNVPGVFYPKSFMLPYQRQMIKRLVKEQNEFKVSTWNALQLQVIFNYHRVN
jgi:hypothetical protein